MAGECNGGSMRYVKSEIVSLRNHPEYNELWVQNRIAEDPQILGLGDVTVKDRERRQPHAGRLDLLLQDTEEPHRYEVEIQLGQTNESHIIRTIEYWDIERKLYPQYDHTAVIAAEDITSRFLNVIGLFNGQIPLIALQMSAIRVEDTLTLHFTKVLDVLPLGFVDEDEQVADEVDREYWLKRASPLTMDLVDDFFEKFIRPCDPNISLKYNKGYIGLAKHNGAAFNFVCLSPKRNTLNMWVKLPQTAEIDEKIEHAALDQIGYNKLYQQYRIRLTKDDLEKNADLLKSLTKMAFDARVGD
jgi:predicted transport protein